MTFLQANGFDEKVEKAEEILKAFREEMTRGLLGEGRLPMLPAGFAMSEKTPCACDLPAFDVGGTNTRSARVRFDETGVPTIQNQLKGFMPGSRGEVGPEAFYRILCDVLAPNLRAGEHLGFCFSYPVDAAGTLLYWTKHIQAPALSGTNVVAGLAAALEGRAIRNVSIRVLNDTVAALLAAYAHQTSETRAAYVGFILGTGTNTAYAESSGRILKCPTLPPGAMIPINCESGNFANFPLSRFDERHEAVSGNGRAIWERCISGVHLGGLGTEILHAAAESTELFSAGLRDDVLSRTFTNIELDNFCAGTSPDLFACSATEAETIRSLLCPMYERAARFAAINMAAAALQSAEARGARGGVCRINADGSTFWKTACVPFREIVRAQLEALLKPRGFSAEIVQIADAPLIGAAIASQAEPAS